VKEGGKEDYAKWINLNLKKTTDQIFSINMWAHNEILEGGRNVGSMRRVNYEQNTV